jgi:12-hydroxyjasmonoyl-L-amino acid 12-hydroxylase / fatty acid hydroxylase
VNDDKYLCDIVVSFVLTGRDTVSSALTTLFMLLSSNPSVASAMRTELPIGCDTSATYELLKGMHINKTFDSISWEYLIKMM